MLEEKNSLIAGAEVDPRTAWLNTTPYNLTK